MRRDARRQMETKRCKMKKRSASGGASTKGRGDGRRRNRPTDETEGGESDGGEREESGFCNRPPLPRVKRLNVCLLTCRALPLFVYLVAKRHHFQLPGDSKLRKRLNARWARGSVREARLVLPRLKRRWKGEAKRSAVGNPSGRRVSTPGGRYLRLAICKEKRGAVRRRLVCQFASFNCLPRALGFSEKSNNRA